MAGDLARKTTGLTPAHVELIKLLAARAVADYLRECDAEESTDENEKARTHARD